MVTWESPKRQQKLKRYTKWEEKHRGRRIGEGDERNRGGHQNEKEIMKRCFIFPSICWKQRKPYNSIPHFIVHLVEFSHLVWHTSWIYNPPWSLYKYVNQNDLLGKLWEGTLLCYPHMHVRPTQKPCCILVSITGRWKAPADVIFAMQVKEYCDVTKPWKMRKSHEMESGVWASRGGSVTHGRLWHRKLSTLLHDSSWNHRDNQLCKYCWRADDEIAAVNPDVPIKKPFKKLLKHHWWPKKTSPLYHRAI